MPNDINKDIVNNLKEKVKKSKSIAVIDYKGLKSNDLNNFRQQVRNQGGETVITKNTLLKIALNEEGIKTKEFDKDLKGTNATVFGYDDPISYFKTIFEFSKKLELPKVRFALINKAFTSSADVEKISELPSREQLLAQVVGGLKSPLSGLVNVLGGTQRKLVTVLSRIAEKKETN